MGHICELVESGRLVEWLLNSMTKMMRVSVLAVVLLGSAIPFAASLDSANPDLTLTNIERKIDLSTQLVKISHAITVSNGGSGATKSIHFAVEKELADKVVFIEATSGPASDKTYLRWSSSPLSPPVERPRSTWTSC